MLERLRKGTGYLGKAVVTLLKKLRFGRRLKLKGIQGFRLDTALIIRNGSVTLGAGTDFSKRVSLTAIEGGQLQIGNGVFMNRNCIVICRKHIRIGDGCIFGPNVLVYDHDHNFDEIGIQPGFKTGDVVIEKGCWIGAGAIILRGTHIGEGCVIGAGSTVKGEIPPHSLVKADRELQIVPLRGRD